jgi:CRP-like cAMP-binding protein
MTDVSGKPPGEAGVRQSLPRELWRQLCGLGTERRFRAGSRMLRQGDMGTHALALVEGLVKVVRHGRDGEVTLLAFRGPGDLLGEVAVFDGGPRIADVVALRPCRAMVLEASGFRALVERQGMVSELMLQTLARLRESNLRQAELLTLPLVTRLARALVRLADLTAPAAPRTRTRTGTGTGTGTGAEGTLRLTGLTQEELALAIGVTRNSVVGALQRLREAGAVETARRSVTIRDMEALRLLAKAGDADER